MRRTLSVTLFILLLVSLADPASGEPSPSLTSAVARAAQTQTLEASAALGHPVPHRPRRTRRKPSARRAVLTGFLVGSVIGGTIGYREYGTEGVWYGVYTLGIPCALAGWTVSR